MSLRGRPRPVHWDWRSGPSAGSDCPDLHRTPAAGAHLRDQHAGPASHCPSVEPSISRGARRGEPRQHRRRLRRASYAGVSASPWSPILTSSRSWTTHSFPERRVCPPHQLLIAAPSASVTCTPVADPGPSKTSSDKRKPCPPPTRYQDLTTRDARDPLGEHCRRSRRRHHRQGSAHPWRSSAPAPRCHERHQFTGTNASTVGFPPSPKNPRCPPAERATPARGRRSYVMAMRLRLGRAG